MQNHSEARPTPAAGTRIDHFEVTRALGRGGMGVVVEALDTTLDRHVALKLLLPSSSASAAQRFAREARALARLAHRGAPRVFSVGQYEGLPYFAMELVRGRTLASLLAEHLVERVPFPVQRAVGVVREMAEALDAAHAQGLVHRDVKPDNVIVEDRTGRVVLVDFGLVHADTESSSRHHTILGTPEYYAPELTLPSARPTTMSDQYQLGCLAYELLVGSPPFGIGGSVPDLIRAHRSTTPLPPSSSRPEARALDAAVLRALAKVPEQRFATLLSFASAIEDAAGPWMDAALAGTDPEIALPAPGSEPRTGRETKSVLVIDDDPVYGRIAARAAQVAFVSQHVEVWRARGLAGALAAIRRRAPDVVVLDHHLIDGEGTDLVARMRWIRGTERSRVIVVSASGAREIGWRYAPFGVRSEDVLQKPVAFSALVEQLADVVARDSRTASAPSWRGVDLASASSRRSISAAEAVTTEQLAPLTAWPTPR